MNSLEWARGGRYLALTGLYSLWFFGFFILSSLFQEGSGSLWYPAAGIRMAMLLLLGTRVIPALVVAEVAAVAAYSYYYPGTHFDQPAQLLNVALTPVIYGFGAWGYQRFVKLDLRLRTVDDAAKFSTGTLLIAFISSLRNAWVDLGVDAGLKEVLNLSLVYWIGDSIGILMLTPLLLVIREACRLRKYTPHPLREAIVGFGVEQPRRLFFDFLAVWITLFALQALPILFSHVETHAHWYVAFLPVIWISFRHGLVGSMIGILATTIGVAWLFSQPMESAGFRELQVFLVILAITSLLMGSMVSTLRRRNQRLREAELRLETDNRELEVQHAEMERFATSVSHDLKSPLMTLRGFLNFLKGDLESGDAQQVKKDLDHIDASVDAMEQLIFDLLEFSRIGSVSHRQAEVSLSELVRDAVWLVTGQIEARGVEIKISPYLPTVLGDRTRLLQAVQNLVDNAVKFMGEQTAPLIEISTREDGGETVIVVRDNGIGIEPDDQLMVFGLFDRLNQQEDGAGVGLALVKRIVEEHGGRIWIESEGQCRGTAFCFTLPVQAVGTVKADRAA